MKTPLLILVGPSAVGKTTVAELLVNSGAFAFVRSLTTRAPRGDGHDDEYLYTDKAGFEAALASGEILEHTLYDGTLYGTPRSEVERVARDGRCPILVLDINGAEALSKDETLAPCIIYLTEDERVLDRRLKERYLMGERVDYARYEARASRNRWERESFHRFSHLFYDIIAGKETASDTAEAVREAFEGYKKTITL